MYRLVLGALCLLLGMAPTGRADDGYIEFLVSAKFMLSQPDPIHGMIAPGDLYARNGQIPCDEVVTIQDLQERIDYANAIFDRSGRGIRFTLEVSTIIPPEDPPVDVGCGAFGTPGQPNGCGETSSCPEGTPPAIVINELMAQPAMASVYDGQWIELHNTTGSPIDLQNWTLENDDPDMITITESLVVPAGGYVVIGRNDDYYVNGNLDLDYEYGNFWLRRGGAEIVLRDDAANEVDRVAWDGSWQFDVDDDGDPESFDEVYRSWCLKSPEYENDCFDAWIPSTTTFWRHWTSTGNSCRAKLHEAAEDDPVGWDWNPNALNLYIAATCSGGASGTSQFNHVTAVMGQNEAGGFLRVFHELGHSLGVCHTHGCPDWSNPPCFCETDVGDDCLEDSPADTSADFGGVEALADTLANREWGELYDSLSSDPDLSACAKKQRVLDVVYNVMSYHRDTDIGFPFNNFGNPLVCDIEQIQDIPCSTPASQLPGLCRHRLTPGQLDRISDFANTLLRRERDGTAETGRFASGLTHFVDQAPSSCSECSDEAYACWPGSSLHPHATLTGALMAAETEDEPGMDHLVLMRPGTYNEPMEVSFPVTIRATRGNATIGE